MPALLPSSVEFIEKASGIKQRHVMEKRAALDVDRMTPDIPERPNEQISVMAEFALQSAKDALDRRRLCRQGHRRGHLLLLEPSAALSRDRRSKCRTLWAQAASATT